MTAAVLLSESSGWVYSIRLTLLKPSGEEGGSPEGLTAEQRGFETAQLRSRHWVITPAPSSAGIQGGEVEHVRGEGVVGKYPVLREGGYRDDEQSYGGGVGAGRWKDGTFVYQSQSGRRPPGGTFGGELTLVPGTIDEPTGAPFDVDVPPFALVRPDFFF